ncbi:NUDIX hydrolase [soil metagenome]
MQTRHSARILIINPDNRILLFRTETAPMDPMQAIPGYWYVPGGGVEADESFEEAARRELWEECGIQNVTIGPCVWIREQVLHFQGMGEALAHERFFPVNARDIEPNFENMIDFEATVLAGHRWWSYDELRSTPDVIFPEALADLLPPLLAGDYPQEPLRIR